MSPLVSEGGGPLEISIISSSPIISHRPRDPLLAPHLLPSPPPFYPPPHPPPLPPPPPLSGHLSAPSDHGRVLRFLHPYRSASDRKVSPLPHEQGGVHGGSEQARQHQAGHHFHRVGGAGEGEQGVLCGVRKGKGRAGEGEGGDTEGAGGA